MEVENKLVPYFDRLVDLVESEQSKQELLQKREAVLKLLGDAYADGVVASAQVGTIGLTSSII